MNEDPNTARDQRTPLDVPPAGLKVRPTQVTMSPWKWFLISTAAVIVAVLLLTNPSRDAHLKAIRDSGGYMVQYTIEYHYYFVFSTASEGHWSYDDETLSYGFLGAVISTKHYPRIVR